MKSLPHHYHVRASVREPGDLTLSADVLPELTAAAPAEFDGSGDQWSPETLLLASVSSCFILSFRAIASFSGLNWESLECGVGGTLDRVERQLRFTEIQLTATLTLGLDGSAETAKKLLQKAEQSCLISRSLICPVKLDMDVVLA